jgi:hypothetical protein
MINSSSTMKFIAFELLLLAFFSITIIQSLFSLINAIEPISVSRINRLSKESATQERRTITRRILDSSSSVPTAANVAAADPFNDDKENYAYDYYDNYDDDDTTKDVQELFLKQRLDHFAFHSSDHFFSQRYFYTSRYVLEEEEIDHDEDKDTTSSTTRVSYSSSLRGRTGQATTDTAASANNISSNTTTQVVFICMGGEGPFLTKTVLTNSTHCSGDMLSLASILSTELHTSVHVFALEHRYYGKSYPTFPSSSSSSTPSSSSSSLSFHQDQSNNTSSSPLTTQHLKYLSSQQALADLAYFVSYIQTTYGISSNTAKIVTFGGSYPGMLAAWSRLKYPHLIHAAVSNSAPLEVVLDFSKYKDVYARSLMDDAVGGSLECVNVLHRAHLDAEEMILQRGKREDLEYIADLFDLCHGVDSLMDSKNVDAFLGDGMVFFDVQENDPSCTEPLCNIEKFCGNITQEAQNGEPPLEILGRISRDMEGGGGDDGRCKDISWEGMMEYLSRVDPGAQRSGVRSWLWQTCTEVGFYQTCEVGTNCPFGRGHHTIDADFEICQRVFGIEPEFVRENVEETLRTYGGWNISSDRILSVNGDIDPWSIQSLSASGRSEKEGDRLPSYWSIGASHHYWTHEVKGTDGFGIMRTRDIIYNWVISVLQQDKDERVITRRGEVEDVTITNNIAIAME